MVVNVLQPTDLVQVLVIHVAVRPFRALHDYQSDRPLDAPGRYFVSSIRRSLCMHQIILTKRLPLHDVVHNSMAWKLGDPC
jgi:hypothetical protein